MLIYLRRYCIYVDMTNPREIKGKAIPQDQIKRIDSGHYQVKSQSSDQWYDIISTEYGFKCSCPDHTFRKVCCKHIHCIEFSLEIKKHVIQHIEQVDYSSCLYCKSHSITKRGIRHNKYGNIQIYFCKDCKKRFSINLGFEKMRSSPQVITSAMQLYFTGESLRNVTKFLQLQGVEISHVSVYNWIKKYVKLMESYLDKMTPQVSDTWRADEIYIKVKGNMKYLFALMDDETRFWIAQEVADSKYQHNAQNLLKMGKQTTGKTPMTFITDGLYAYNEAFRKEFDCRRAPRPQHIRQITFNNRRHNNNKMERLNGEIRDREKVVRGVKSKDSPLFKGAQIYHNYIRSHMGLNGETPADRAGIKIQGENKWITLIQNAKQVQ